MFVLLWSSIILISFNSTSDDATCLCRVMCVCSGVCKAHCVFAGGLHDLAEADADSLPLVALVGAQSVLQDGNNLRENLLAQLPHQISQCPSSDLKPRRHTASVRSIFIATGKTNFKRVFHSSKGVIPFSCQGTWKPGSPAGE